MKLLSIFLIALTSCTSAHNHVTIVPVPNDPDAHVVGYQVVPRFTGIEVTIGVPALAFVPVIGPLLAEAVKIKAGGYDTLVIPILQEDQYAHQARIAAARARWGSKSPRVP